MSLAGSLPPRELADHSSIGLAKGGPIVYTATSIEDDGYDSSYDDSILDDFYDVDDPEEMIRTSAPQTIAVQLLKPTGSPVELDFGLAVTTSNTSTSTQSPSPTAADTATSQVDSPSQLPPSLPQKSALRASRLLNLDGYTLDKLASSMDGASPMAAAAGTTAPPSAEATLEQSAIHNPPHDVYLSSEEDASSSADDFSDYDDDSDSMLSESGTTSPLAMTASTASPARRHRRGSREDTARVVSVIFSGKPSLISLSGGRRSISPSSQHRPQQPPSLSKVEDINEASPPLPPRRANPTPSVLSMPVDTRRVSISSTSTSATASQPPPRKSSMITSLFTRSSKPPAFLSIDPYANGSTYSLVGANGPHPSPVPHSSRSASASTAQAHDEEANGVPRTPKTPTAAVFKSVTRTLSIVRKRSRPYLAGMSSAAQPSREDVAGPQYQQQPQSAASAAMMTPPQSSSGLVNQEAKDSDDSLPIQHPPQTPPLQQQQQQKQQPFDHATPPQSPDSVDERFRFARRNTQSSIVLPRQSVDSLALQEQQAQPKESKRKLLSGLGSGMAAMTMGIGRKRSVKVNAP